ncbi:tetratricopeptide repeat protein, partial [Arcobacter sp. CECT 8985]|uniref:SEL1-like repeat protein n=1 Tax=Arcobacter sp. CECT 8985 TaxID=1935424 RepID=UPI0010273751
KSAHNLGVYYYKNFKYDEAYKWFMKSYKTGDLNSLLSIGLMYIDEKKYDEAIKTFKKVGKLGEPRGYRSLGFLFIKNKDVKNDKEGIKYLKKCYEMGYGLCAGGLGAYYEENKKDYKKAEEWYKKGFELKNEESINRLGFMYLKDLNNPKKAIYWFKQGYNKINCKSCIEITAKTYIINLEDYPNAIKWYKIDYKENKTPEAVYNLGLLYEYSKNKKEAIKWYKKAMKYKNIRNLATKKLKKLGVSYE